MSSYENKGISSNCEGVQIIEQCTEDTATTTLMSKPGTKSKVWQYFGFEVGEKGGIKDVNASVCCMGNCNARVKIKHSSTTNLYRHLKQHHPKEYELVKESNTHKCCSIRF